MNGSVSALKSQPYGSTASVHDDFRSLAPKEFDLYQAARQLDTLCGFRVGVNLGWLRIATLWGAFLTTKTATFMEHFVG